MSDIGRLWQSYGLRWKRRRLLFRAWRKRRQLRAVVDRSGQIQPGDILVFSTVRNESVRLPFFLDHYRRLGVRHFLFVDNGSTDGTTDYLTGQPDVSLWQTSHSYKLSRFGLDWLTWLQIRHGHRHWALSVDADEILIYPYWTTRPLPALTEWLDSQSISSFGAMMIDLYPKGRLDGVTYQAGQDPVNALGWFDRGNHMIRQQPLLQNLWIQGGVRARCFFADDPRRAPTLSKTPLVKWNRTYAYVSSTHSLLPRRLNRIYGDDGRERMSGALLHTKFLHTIVEKSREEKQRQEHFANSALYNSYYDRLAEAPDLWCEQSSRFAGWRQLEAMGLLSRGGWL